MNRKILVAVAILGLMFTGSTLAIVVSPSEADSTGEPLHTNPDPSTPTVSLSELFERAPLPPPRAVKVAGPISLASISRYQIRPGDTLGMVAKAWHIDIAKLACRNGIPNPDVVFPGRWILRNGIKCKPRPVVHAEYTRTATVAQPSSKVEIAIQFAMMQIGEPYVYGAAGPSSWDCSGLVMQAFSQIGIQLPHYTGAMIGHGTPVSRSQMRRGDIVFPSSGHVGIYLGDNQYVNAPQPGETVKVGDVYAFYAARRLV